MESKGTTPSAVAVEGEQEPEKVELKINEWEVAESQGIRIRRRPPTGPLQHFVGPFEFQLQNEGNTPRNILEEIIWHKDTQVAQLKQRQSLYSLKKDLDNAPPVRGFVGALRAAHSRTGLSGSLFNELVLIM